MVGIYSPFSISISLKRIKTKQYESESAVEKMYGAILKKLKINFLIFGISNNLVDLCL